MRRVSQNDKIISYLEKHGSITPLEALKELSCFRLAARIADLEKIGYTFTRTPTKVINAEGQICRVTSYSLEDE